jgi:hypothetical protein
MYISLLQTLDLKKPQILCKIAEIRAEHIRHLVQEGVMASR